jgi:penicillin-binding protein 2
MQVAYTIGGLVLGGKFMQPHLLKDTTPAPEIHFPISGSTVETITSGMWGVVNEAGGTAAASRLPGIEFGGKTGTAQTISLQGRQRAGQKAEFKDNAWFVGFAPRRNAEIVVAVLVQSGEHGSSAAAPIAKEIVKTYYDKKNGIKPGILMTKGPATRVDPTPASGQGQPIELAPAEEQLPVSADR